MQGGIDMNNAGRSSVSQKTKSKKLIKYFDADSIDGLNPDRLTQREMLWVVVNDIKHIRCQQKKTYAKVETHDTEIENNTIALTGIQHDLTNHLSMHKKHIALTTLVVSIIVAVSQLIVKFF